MLKIHETLLDKLFFSPNPQSLDIDLCSIYHKLRLRMFPGEENFKAFLLAQSSDVQYEKAETIIHRLCYESNFPPTYFAIKDVIAIEELQNTKYSGFESWTPRDHFIHIVNLYLLGIYLFFYDSEFRNHIISDNRFQRNSNNFFQHQLDSYKDFISEWKYFCLYHDVGYTQEFFGHKYKSTIPEEDIKTLLTTTDFMSSFNKKQLVAQNSFFGSLEILSRLFTWEATKQISNRNCDGGSKLFKFFKKEKILSSDNRTISFEKDCVPLLKNMKKIEKVFSNQCLKPLLPIICENNVGIVGIERKSGNVAFLSLCIKNSKNNTANRVLFYSEKMSDDSELEDFIRNPNLLLFDDYVSDKYELIYLYDCISAAQYYTINIYNSGYISSAFKYLEDNDFGTKFYGISNEKQMLDFYYEIYFFMYSCIRKYPSLYKEMNSDFLLNDITDLEALSPFDNADSQKIYNLIVPRIQRLLSTEYADKLSATCIEYIEERCKPSIASFSSSEIDKTIEAYVENYRKSLEDLLKDDMAKKLLEMKTVQAVNASMTNTERFLTAFMCEYVAIKRIFSCSLNAYRTYSFDYIKRNPSCYSTLYNAFLPRKICNTNLNPAKFMDIYMADLTKDNDKECKYRSVLDHGFESAKYACSVFTLLQTVIKNRDKNQLAESMVDILFSISSKETKEESLKHYIDDYNHVFNNVVYAILIHNVYPSVFVNPSNRNMVVTIEDEPFAYFSLLCDSIQMWNRPQGLSHTYTDIHPYRKASEEFNILIQNDKIQLFESKDEKMQNQIRNTIDGMTNLKSIKSFAEVAFTENNN